MTTFKVSTDDLRCLASALSGLAAQLSATGQLHVDVGVAGHPRVENELGSFVGNWSDGLHAVEQNLAKFNQRLDAAADEYDQTDGHVAAGFGGR